MSYRVQGSYTVVVDETYETQREATERAEHLAREQEGASFVVWGDGLSASFNYSAPREQE